MKNRISCLFHSSDFPRVERRKRLKRRDLQAENTKDESRALYFMISLEFELKRENHLQLENSQLLVNKKYVLSLLL